MKFAGFHCFLCVHVLSLALPADPTAKDVKTQSSLVMENEDTRSVFPEEVDKYYSSKQATPQYEHIWRYKLVPVFVDPRVPHIEYTLVEDQPSEINPRDLQEDAPENAEKSSVDKAIHRLKRHASWGIGGSRSIPLISGHAPTWPGRDLFRPMHTWPDRDICRTLPTFGRFRPGRGSHGL